VQKSKGGILRCYATASSLLLFRFIPGKDDVCCFSRTCLFYVIWIVQILHWNSMLTEACKINGIVAGAYVFQYSVRFWFVILGVCYRWFDATRWFILTLNCWYDNLFSLHFCDWSLFLVAAANAQTRFPTLFDTERFTLHCSGLTFTSFVEFVLYLNNVQYNNGK